MYKTTNDFFDLVRTGNVSEIDIQEFVYKKTKKHNIEKLKTLLKDIEFYLFVEKEFLISEITPEMWTEKHNYYKEKGKEMPFEEFENIMIKLKAKKGIDTSNEPKYYRYYNHEKIFFPYEFFCIYQLGNYIGKLIDNDNESNFKHEHIFSNNGFILFEHILNNYVKSGRGRKSDIAFFYWKMFNDKNHFIHQRPESFKNWFFSTYNNEDLGKLKTYDMVKNPNRIKDYSTAIEWFKTHNK